MCFHCYSPHTHFNEHTVRCWYARYKITQNGEWAEKQQTKAEKRYRSRAKLTLKEEYILEKIMKWSLMDACFPKKEQILVLVNQITDNRVPMTKTTWEWIRRWLHRRGFSYKKITTRSTGRQNRSTAFFPTSASCPKSKIV